MEAKAKEFSIGAFTSWQRWLRLAFVGAFVLATMLRGSRGTFSIASLLVLAVGIALSLVGAAPSHLIVGSDGILLRSLLTRRFFAYGDIDHVALRNVYSAKNPRQVTGIQLEIEPRAGDVSQVSLREGSSRDVFEAIVEARRAHRARTVGAFDAHALRPDGNDARAWLERLRARAGRVQGFRVDAPSREELLAIVEDPKTDEEARAAAAVVIATERDDEATSRLRVAHEATASPRLRVAIEAALEGEDDAVVKALEDLRPPT